MKPITVLSVVTAFLCLSACIDEREKDAGDPFYTWTSSLREKDCDKLPESDRAQCLEKADLPYDEAEQRHQEAEEDRKQK